jgi:hypothetical protein
MGVLPLHRPLDYGSMAGSRTLCGQPPAQVRAEGGLTAARAPAKGSREGAAPAEMEAPAGWPCASAAAITLLVRRGLSSGDGGEPTSKSDSTSWTFPTHESETTKKGAPWAPRLSER